MTEAAWLQLIAEVVGSYTTSSVLVSAIIAELREDDDYGLAHALWTEGDSVTAQHLLHHRIVDMGYTQGEK